MDLVRRPVVHDVKLYTGAKEPMIGSLCVSAYYLLFSNRRHEGQDEITVSHIRHVIYLLYCVCSFIRC